jgi:thioredoxin reductase
MAAEAQWYEAIIIGGGPAGLNAALVLGRACRKVIVIDAGRPRNRAARKLHGFLSRDGIDPRSLLDEGRNELTPYGVQQVQDIVVDAARLPQAANQHFATAFRVSTQTGHEFHARKLLFASGTVDEIPDFPGVAECYGATVHHCPYCDGWEHRGKHLIAFGLQAEKAVGLALSLISWSPNVTAVTNGESVPPRDRQLLARNGIQVVEDPLLSLQHQEGHLRGLDFKGKFLPADALFFNTRQRAQSTLPRLLGCEMDDDCFVTTRGKQKSDIPGLYLAGDADGDVQFAIVAAAEGATAAVAINRELQEEDRAE